MAQKKASNATDTFTADPKTIKRNDELTREINDMLAQMQLSLYGTTSKEDINSLTNKFNTVMKSELDSINRHTTQDMTSFITKLFENDITRGGGPNGNLQGFDAIFNAEDGNVMNFLSEAYQNRMLKFSDLKEVSSQLVELREAIKITRDSIISSDITTGTVSKEIEFDFSSTNKDDDKIAIIEHMEKKFNLDKKIKNFIVPNALTYGNYYVCCFPYAKIFSDFTIRKNKDINFMGPANVAAKTESVSEHEDNRVIVLESVMEESDYKDIARLGANVVRPNIPSSEYTNLNSPYSKGNLETTIESEVEQLAKHIAVCNTFDPVSVMEETSEELQEFYEEGLYTEDHQKTKNKFDEYHNIDTGALEIDSKEDKKVRKSFSDIKDCYVRMADPCHMIPIKILQKVIGYYYIEEDNIEPINGILTSTIYNNRYDGRNTQRTIIDKLAAKIVKAFDKKFLTQNSKMKDLIAEALMYYDLNSKSIKFQFIPAEYVTEFKINENEEGDGVSVLEDSLFYAKLYLMLLLFKIVSIVLYSNDTKVNYIKTSGIDKNIANKIQEIAREKQARQINLMDLMSYTSIVNKIGRGNETYIPVGRSGDRGLETEILQGQDVNLNTDLMEMLKTAYILGTGVPSAIMNYLNEADFAKSIETANSKFQGRVMSLQIDFNEQITQLYRMIAMFSTDIDETELNTLTVKLTPPKFQNNNIKQEMLNSFSALRDFLVALYFGDQAQQDPNLMIVVREFSKRLAADYLPTINFQDIEQYIAEAKIVAEKEKLNPENKQNTDEIDNLEGF